MEGIVPSPVCGQADAQVWEFLLKPIKNIRYLGHIAAEKEG